MTAYARIPVCWCHANQLEAGDVTFAQVWSQTRGSVTTYSRIVSVERGAGCMVRITQENVETGERRTYDTWPSIAEYKIVGGPKAAAVVNGTARLLKNANLRLPLWRGYVETVTVSEYQEAGGGR